MTVFDSHSRLSVAARRNDEWVFGLRFLKDASIFGDSWSNMEKLQAVFLLGWILGFQIPCT